MSDPFDAPGCPMEFFDNDDDLDTFLYSIDVPQYVNFDDLEAERAKIDDYGFFGLTKPTVTATKPNGANVSVAPAPAVELTPVNVPAWVSGISNTAHRSASAEPATAIPNRQCESQEVRHQAAVQEKVERKRSDSTSAIQTREAY